MVNFLPAVAYHFCLNLPATFSKPCTSIISGPSRFSSSWLRSMKSVHYGCTDIYYPTFHSLLSEWLTATAVDLVVQSLSAVEIYRLWRGTRKGQKRQRRQQQQPKSGLAFCHGGSVLRWAEERWKFHARAEKIMFFLH